MVSPAVSFPDAGPAQGGFALAALAEVALAEGGIVVADAVEAAPDVAAAAQDVSPGVAAAALDGFPAAVDASRYAEVAQAAAAQAAYAVGSPDALPDESDLVHAAAAVPDGPGLHDSPAQVLLPRAAVPVEDAPAALRD